VPLGYYKDEAKTRTTFVEVDGERWVLPGDNATVDEDGTVVLLGRGADRGAAALREIQAAVPGARLDFTHGFRCRPRSTAFFASRPAPTITCGFDVFVQLVIAAITTEPCSSA